MKKIITILSIALFVLLAPSFVAAQGNSQGSAKQGMGVETGIGNKSTGAATQSLNRVVERNNNPEVGEQVRAMVESHSEVQARTQTALNKMDERGAAMRFLLGPDYKNAGQVRSDVVGLRNDINKLEMLKADLVEEDAEDVQTAIDELTAEAGGLEAELEEKLTGFSLFGWLAKMLAE